MSGERPVAVPFNRRPAHAPSLSRGIMSSEVVTVPSHKGEGAERRQALGCCGTLERASDVGPRGEIARPCVPAPIAHAIRAAGGRSPLGAPRGDLLAPSPPWRDLGALHMSGARRSCIGAFARPARSGGRAVLPGRLPGACLQGNPQDAGPALLMQCLATSTLGGRDDRKIITSQCVSKNFSAIPSLVTTRASKLDRANFSGTVGSSRPRKGARREALHEQVGTGVLRVALQATPGGFGTPL